MSDTLKKYDTIIQDCLKIFNKKYKDYGAAWRILRLPSLTDQIFIKAKRIRQIQELKTQKINEGQEDEYIGIINYSLMALIQIKEGVSETPDMDYEKAVDLYKEQVAIVKNLMQNKNHDYGDVWRSMRISSLTDLILQKLLRIKALENRVPKNLQLIKEHYQDIINYAIFSIIHLQNGAV